MINLILVKVLHIKQWVSLFIKNKNIYTQVKKLKCQKQKDHKQNAKTVKNTKVL